MFEEGEMIVDWSYKVGTAGPGGGKPHELVAVRLKVEGREMTLAMTPANAAGFAQDLVDAARRVVKPKGPSTN
jgi:hypothetical protein